MATTNHNERKGETMTGTELINDVKEFIADLADETDGCELFARGDTYPSREKLKHHGFEWLSDDQEWRLQVTRVSDAGCLVVSGQYGVVTAEELTELTEAGVEFSVE